MATKDSIRWASIETSEMMREDMKHFLEFLKKFNIDYITYSSPTGKKLYMKLALPNVLAMKNVSHETQEIQDEFWRQMNGWVFYHPIDILKKEPKISDYDILEDMSIDPYDIDKWRGT